MSKEHEIYSSTIQATSLTYTGGELKVKESDKSSGFGIRALDDGRLGFSYCQTEKQIAKTIKRALTYSKSSPKTSMTFPGQIKPPRLDLVDKNLAAMDSNSLNEIVSQLRSSAEVFGGKARVILSAGIDETKIENTSGFSNHYNKSYFSFYVDVMHGDGNGFAIYSSYHLPKSFSEFGETAALLAKDLRGAKKPKSGEYTIILRPESLSELLEILMPSFSGDWKRRAITKLTPGNKSFSDSLSIYDDPLAKANSSRPFDDEGSISKRRTLVDHGVVSSYLYDLETAALSKIRNQSGFCSRNAYDSSPSPDTSNILIQPGNVSNVEELDRNYIEIYSMHGSHTANQTTGDFGLEVNAAFCCDSKGVRKPVRGFMLTGNVFDLFSNISGIEKKQETYADLITPRIAFNKLRVVV